MWQSSSYASIVFSLPLLLLPIEETLLVNGHITENENENSNRSYRDIYAQRYQQRKASLQGYMEDTYLHIKVTPKIIRNFMTLLRHSKYTGYWILGMLGSFSLGFVMFGTLASQLTIITKFQKYEHSDCGWDCVTRYTLYCAISSWLGGFVTLLVITRNVSILGCQLHGFIICGVMCFILAIVNLHALLSHVKESLFIANMVLLCLLNFAISAGPAPSLFCLPSVLFPLHVRSTANGTISSVGKVGGLVGVILVYYLKSDISILFVIMGVVSFVGATSTIVILGYNISTFRQGDLSQGKLADTNASTQISRVAYDRPTGNQHHNVISHSRNQLVNEYFTFLSDNNGEFPDNLNHASGNYSDEMAYIGNLTYEEISEEDLNLSVTNDFSSRGLL